MTGKLGQGRRFEIRDALEAAMTVFWQHGYEGASISTLTAAMGINSPSLYKAFGSKEQLFFEVVRHYNETSGAFMGRAFAEEEDGIALSLRLLREAAEYYPKSRFPGGCLIISAAVTVSEANKHVGERLALMRNANISQLAGRIGMNAAMARFVGATLQGMSQQARDGASAEDLHEIADLAIAVIKQS